MKILKWLKDFFLSPQWTDSSHEVFVVAAYMQIFCSVIAFFTATIVLLEIRRGPCFVSRVIISIMVVAIAIIIVQAGIVLDWFDTHITNAIGTFFFCLYSFLDINIYWMFAIRYWETSFHITSYLKR